jgi:hypothetical protein
MRKSRKGTYAQKTMGVGRIRRKEVDQMMLNVKKCINLYLKSLENKRGKDDTVHLLGSSRLNVL